MKDQRWILPEGIEEVAPPRAHELEVLRRELVDMYATWGYRLIMPPMVEYLESLLVGTARDLDLDTVKFVDQVSGRMMGIRADMTPQA
ncbi:MAG: ATP phosphoribosyltransferase regulatory subunit, partial [Gammaproteobacteria bacterium]|nr:ATP phosphoribosyltransferase regulatory subunit [Gammaproteobacteria bacterium]